MNAEQKSKLFYDLVAWSIWAEKAKVQAKAIREVKIQCAKMMRMFSDPIVTPTPWEILAGKKLSKNQLKKRGKAHQRLEQQMKHIRKYVAQALKEDAKNRNGEILSKAKARAYMQSVDGIIEDVSELIEKKYGSRTQHLLKG